MPSSLSIFSSTALLLTGFATSFLSSGLRADDLSIVEKEVTVFGFNRTLALDESILEVGVLDQDDLTRSTYPDISRTLDELPGVYVSNQGGIGGVTSVFIRGEDSFRTRLFLDGMELTDLSTPQASARFDFATFPALDRAELIYGAQGLRYSADAGGVIALQSRRGDAFTTNDRDLLVTASAGELDTATHGLAFRTRYDRGDLSLAVNRVSTNGFNARSDDDRDGDDEDGFEQVSFNGRTSFNINSDSKLYASAFLANGDNQYDDGFSEAPTNDFDQTAFLLGFSEETENLRMAVEYSQTIGKRQEPFNNTRGKLEKIEFNSSYDFTDRQTFGALAGIRTERLSDSNAGSREKRSQRFLAAEYQTMPVDNLTINAGIRFDDTEVAGDFDTYRAGVAYQFGIVNLRADIGTGFRLPAFAEIAYNEGPFAATNAPQEFEPEESTSASLTARVNLNSVNVGLTLFNSEIDNLIYFDNVGFSGYFQSSAETRSRGATLDFDVEPVPFLKMFGSYTYNDNEIGENDLYAELNGEFERLRRPRDQYETTIRAFTKEETLMLDLRFYGRANTPDYAFGSGAIQLDNFHLVDLELFYQATPRLLIWARAENLREEDYTVVPNFNSSGRTAYIGFQLEI